MFEGINSIKHINAQGTEPARVLSKDEVYHGAGLGWLENWLAPDDEDPEMIMLGPCAYLRGFILSMECDTDCDYVDITDSGAMMANYGKRYGLRIWTAKPTDEQREAAEWDG